MKKLLVLLLILSLLVCTGCSSFKDKFSNRFDIFGKDDEVTDEGTNNDTGSDKPTDKPNGSEEKTHKYLDFSSTEKNLFTRYIGAQIPFIPCDVYYVEGLTDDSDYENGINFYTEGNTQAEFDAYRESFKDYTLTETYTGTDGSTWYEYKKDDVVVKLSFDGTYVDVYVTSSLSNDPEDKPDGPSVNPPVTNTKEDEWRKNYSVITVAEALTKSDSYTEKPSDERFYIIATIVEISNEQYGEMTVKDSTGEIYVYGADSADGSTDYGKLSSKPAVGDVVLFYATLKNHNGLREIHSGWIIDFYTPGGSSDGPSVNPPATNTKEDEWRKNHNVITVAEALTKSDSYTEKPSDERFYIIATIVEISNEQYGEMTVKDSTGEIYVYGADSADGSTDYGKLSSKPAVGDVVLFYATLKNHNGLREIHSGWIIDFYTPNGNSGNTGTGSGSGSTTDANVITNAGAGLPESNTGIYDVDFTTATNVKDVTDQGYYLDGCPTTGSPAVLVIPVEFSNSLASSKGYTTDALVNAFGEGGDVDYYSVHDYYYISSYNQLDLDITVLDFWFKPQYDSNYYYNATYDYSGSEIAIGDQLILDEALAYLEGIMDLSAFDSDNNGTIDAVVLVNTLEIGEEDFFWAYRYWNVYTDDEGYYFEYDGVSANDYIWASYQFLYESYDADGNVTYEDSSVMNTYTFIHEFGHILGADDYYDTTYVGSPMGGADIMDSSLGDQNAYTKFNFGWITTSKLIVTDSSVTVNLGDFSKAGETLIIANNWSDELGAYQEYYVIAYYTNKGLNDNELNYFQRDGVVVYHVNASLYSEDYDGEIYYDVYNNNTDASDEYGTEDNLIEYVKTASDTYTYVVGDTLPALTDDLGNALGHTFVIDALTEEYATITFTVV